MRTVLAFGTFDLYHPGHDFFLAEAAALGDELHVSVARDEHVKQLKQHIPSRNQEQRMATVRRHLSVTHVHLSDQTLGTYQLVQKIKPDVIALGHDQHGLAADLERWIKENGWQGRIVQIEKK